MDINDVTQPLVRQKKSFSKIWLLPILAALIGVGMVANDWRNRGIQIHVVFKTAEGLVAGKTRVKYRDVDIGLVNGIRFGEQRDTIIAAIEIQKEMHDLLKIDSQLWVVKPRIGAGGVSGIGTFLSGAYIELSPGIEDRSKTDFVGLEIPPVTPLNTDGLHLTLESKGGKPLSVGSAVVYRGFNVGQVESFTFDPEIRAASYGIFINAPYDALITSNTIFWNTSGFELTANADGMRFDMGSIETLLAGGVEFDIPSQLSLGERVTESRTFDLYKSMDGLNESREYDYFEYLVLTQDSVGGLQVGAPVEYLGIRIGTVSQPYLSLDTALDGINNLQADPRIPILIRIEPARAYKSDSVDIEKFKTELERGILKGTYATIESANFLTGSLKVSLNPGDESITKIEKYGQYKVIPSKRSGVSAISDQIKSLLTKIESLPLDETVRKTNTAIGNADDVLLTLDKSLQALQITLKGLQPESEVYESMNATMNELQETLQSVKPLLKELSEKPSSLIFSRAHGADKEPKAETNSNE